MTSTAWFPQPAERPLLETQAGREQSSNAIRRTLPIQSVRQNVAWQRSCSAPSEDATFSWSLNFAADQNLRWCVSGELDPVSKHFVSRLAARGWWVARVRGADRLFAWGVVCRKVVEPKALELQMRSRLGVAHSFGSR